MNERILKAKGLANDRPDEALRILNDILDEDPDTEEAEIALFMSAYIMMQANKTGLAYHIYQRCAQMRPNRSEIWSNMGMCLEESNPEKAIKLFTKAYQLDNKNNSAIANKALLYLHTGRPKQCVSLCDQALKIDPNMRSALHNKGLAKIMMRDWSGWKEYYETIGVKNREAKDYGVPNWEGQEGTVLVYGEQGVGDEIMFASCLEDLSKTNKIVLDCDRRLESIFKRSFPYSVYGHRFKDTLEIQDGDQFDYQIAIGQLPHFFRKKDSDFPGKPYLKPDPERVKMWDSIMGEGLRIGFSMFGGGKETREKYRSTNLDTFSPLFGNNLINLDYKKVDEDELKEHGIKYWARGVKKGSDLEELLAIIANLDRVVTVCTTVVYFAGALGVPCDVLVPEYCGYRYHNSGDTFPWYKSVKLHRGNFKENVSKIAGDINADMYRVRQKGNSSVPRSYQQYNEAFVGAC